MYAQFFGTYEFTLNHKINVFGLLVTNAKNPLQLCPYSSTADFKICEFKVLRAA